MLNVIVLDGAMLSLTVINAFMLSAISIHVSKLIDCCYAVVVMNTIMLSVILQDVIVLDIVMLSLAVMIPLC